MFIKNLGFFSFKVVFYSTIFLNGSRSVMASKWRK
uniref:Bm256 n=1 Tax=Brugia malayi TaxID=6279 RepID=A0A1I9G0C6_BRUMA|nr:Bm256 [Brugia malayi]